MVGVEYIREPPSPVPSETLGGGTVTTYGTWGPSGEDDVWGVHGTAHV